MNELSKENINFLDSSFLNLLPLFTKNKFSKIAVIVDENTYHSCYPVIGVLPAHHLIEIKSGESNKVLETCTHIWQKLTEFEFDRKGLVINLGGGVIGDMGGFCASTYKRGIKFIQIPTTLLSMVDASVGGKLGIDFNGFKNHIGVFEDPQGVYVYPGFLKTLDRKELRSGFAEIIKHCLIRDKDKWHEIQQITTENINDTHFDWSPLIKHSIHIKSTVVKADPRETGLRKILNFGHTIGHAVESFFLENADKKLLHGEAIAVGMICEAFLSFKKGYMTKEELAEIKTYILGIFGKASISKKEIEQMIPLTMQDKKNSFGKVKFSLLNKVGECGFDIEVSKKEMEESLLFYISED